MEPVSSNNRPSPDDPTPAELEAGACLPPDPEPFENRLTEAPPPPTAAGGALVDKHPPGASAASRPLSAVTPAAGKSSHAGVALSLGVNFAAGPGVAAGAEASVGVVVDLSEPKISVFSSSGWGTAIAPGVAAGISAQASIVRDVAKFWGSGAEHGLDLPAGGVAINYTTPVPGGPLEFNGLTACVSPGPGIGGDAHYFEGTTTERGSLSLSDIRDVLKRAASLPGPRRFGP